MEKYSFAGGRPFSSLEEEVKHLDIVSGLVRGSEISIKNEVNNIVHGNKKPNLRIIQ